MQPYFPPYTEHEVDPGPRGERGELLEELEGFEPPTAVKHFRHGTLPEGEVVGQFARDPSRSLS